MTRQEEPLSRAATENAGQLSIKVLSVDPDSEKETQWLCTRTPRSEPAEASAPEQPESDSANEPTNTTSEGKKVPRWARSPELWRKPVDGKKLLAQLVRVIRRHMSLHSQQAYAVALWTFFAHSHNCFDISPLLMVSAPEKGSGKTTLLKLLDQLVPKPMIASNFTPAVIFRLIDANQSTLLLDEGEHLLAPKTGGALGSLLNSGYTRESAQVPRNVASGDDYDLRVFSTWAPKALAFNGRLSSWDTLHDRAIEIRLKRLKLGVKVARLDHKAKDKLSSLPSKLARWARDNESSLRDADPEMPEHFDARVADNWRPLFAIAERMGPWVSAEARRTAEWFVETKDADREESSGTRLLRGIREVFAAEGSDFIGSQELAVKLSERSEGTFKDMLTARTLAKKLREFEVKPSSNGKQRGYKRADFEDAWERYLPPDSAAVAT